MTRLEYYSPFAVGGSVGIVARALDGARTFDNGLSNQISNIPDLYSTL
jgi:hypothetical protein